MPPGVVPGCSTARVDTSRPMFGSSISAALVSVLPTVALVVCRSAPAVALTSTVVEVEPTFKRRVDRHGGADVDFLRADLENREALFADGDDIGAGLHVDDDVAAGVVGQGGLGSAGRAFEEVDFGADDSGILFIGDQAGDGCGGGGLRPGWTGAGCEKNSQE